MTRGLQDLCAGTAPFSHTRGLDIRYDTVRFTSPERGYRCATITIQARETSLWQTRILAPAGESGGHKEACIYYVGKCYLVKIHDS